jgi:DNA adenine methylase
LRSGGPLVRRIQKIAAHAKRITLYHLEAKRFIRHVLPTLPAETFMFADPPYYCRGKDLYLNVYGPGDHAELAREIQDCRSRWLVSYDNVTAVRRLYSRTARERFRLSYSVQDRYVGSELFFFSTGLRVPRQAIPHYPVKHSVRWPD